MSVFEKLQAVAETRSTFLAALEAVKTELDEQDQPDADTRTVLMGVAHDMTVVSILLKNFADGIRAREAGYSARDRKSN